MAKVAHPYRAIVIALLASLLLWNLPLGGFVMYPLKLLATWLHELSHGVTMLVTGAGFDHMDIYRDTSGFAIPTRGVGSAASALIASAGYMGTPLCGTAIMLAARSERGARTALAVLAAALALSAALWVRNGFGLGAVLVGAVAMAAAARVASARVAIFVASFVAAQACIHAVLDIRVLFRADLVVDGQVMQASDAHSMAAATFGSPQLWASLWLAWSFAVFYTALRLTRDPDPARASSHPDARPTAALPGGSDCSVPRRSRV